MRATNNVEVRVHVAASTCESDFLIRSVQELLPICGALPRLLERSFYSVYLHANTRFIPGTIGKVICVNID